MGDPICDAFVAMMRYSEIPRDLSSDSLRCAEYGDEKIYRNLRDDSPQSDISSNSGPALPLIASEKCRESSHHKKHSTSSIGPIEFAIDKNGTTNYKRCVTPTNKSQSLPPNSSIQDIDSIIINCLRVSPEELANQITLLDFPVFAAILPDELTSCAWTKKNKCELAPNVVAFTKRFNHTIFWTVQEILNGISPKERAEIIAHFIKVAKKLHELNNLHSLFAITSAMKCASVYRLTKTWACLSKKDKQQFDRLADIFNEENNWATLREYLESLKLPCIPYLGLFLTDLVYIDLAHPHKGGLEPEQRQIKMNNILRVISNYQGSDYLHILPIAKTLNYLQSVRYIEELQNIFEDDQYKKSLKLEPSSSSTVNHSSSLCSSKESVTPVPLNHLDPSTLASLNLSPAKSNSMRLTSNTTSSASKFIPGHRKCRSLGTNIFNKISCTSQTTSTIQRADSFHKSRHLLDDSVLEDKVSTDATSTGSSEGIIGFETDNEIANEILGFQGCVRRKTVLKDRRKPAVASWQRYWLQIWANSLVYFSPKSFKGTERSDYKREPSKICSLEGWTAEAMENSQHSDTFQLINHHLGHIYKFRTGSTEMTILWLNALRKVISQNNSETPLPINLMSFE